MPEDINKLAEERRAGFLVGMSISELMLLIIFALLLFMAESFLSAQGNREILDGLNPSARALIKENKSLLNEIDPGWLQLVATRLPADPDLIEAYEKLSQELEKLRRELAQVTKENEGLDGQNRDLINSLAVEQSKQGLTTLCSYERTEQAGGRRSLPIGVVLLKDTTLTLLEKGYGDKEVIDYYFDPADINPAMSEIEQWQVGQSISWDQFSDYAGQLNSIGDNYANEERQSCRFYFSYWEEGIEITKLEQFNRINYSQVRISEENFAGYQLLLDLESNELDSNLSSPSATNVENSLSDSYCSDGDVRYPALCAAIQ